MDFITASKLGFSIKEVAKKMQVEMKPNAPTNEHRNQLKKVDHKPLPVIIFFINQTD